MPYSYTDGMTIWNSWNFWNATNAAAWTQGSDTAATWTHWNQYFGTAGAITMPAATTTTAASTSATWVYWNNSWYADTNTWAPPAVGYPLTEEEVASRNAEIAREAEERRESEERARQLLLDYLDDEQRDEYEQQRHFTVISRDGERHYRVEHGRSRNVKLIGEDGRVLHTYCAHPAELVPDEDTMLAQLLMLRGDEEETFLRIANAS